MRLSAALPLTGSFNGTVYMGKIEDRLNDAFTLFGGNGLAIPTFPNMLVAEENTGKVWQRNVADSAWIHIGYLNTPFWGLLSLADGGVLAATKTLELGRDPTAAMESATKQYVDARPKALNLAVNGAMMIDTANEGASVTVNSGSTFYSVDMWHGQGTASAGTFTMQQSSATPPAGFKNYLRITTGTADASPAAGAIYVVGTRVEGLNVVDLQLGTAGALNITTSAKLRSSLTGTFSGAFRNAAGTRSYPWTCTISAANTWTPIAVTLAGDTTGTWAIDNTTGLEMLFDLGCGSTYRGTASAWVGSDIRGVTSAVRLISTAAATLDITGVQIESGSSASGFDKRHYQFEQLLCARYAQWVPFDMNFLAAGAGDGMESPVLFPVPMRAVPSAGTIVVDPNTSQTGGNNASNLFQRLSKFGASAALSAITAGTCYVVGYRSLMTARL